MTAGFSISAVDAAAARKILIINVTRIGDTLLATPAIRAIAQFFPNASITVLGHAKRVEVLAHIAYIDRVGSISKHSAAWRGWRDALFGAEYDWAFVWRNDDALVRYALRKARRVVAHAQTDERINRRLTVAVPQAPDNTVHAVAWGLSIPRAASIPDAGYALDYVVTAEEHARAKARLLAAFHTDVAGGPMVALQVASFPTKSYRDWPIECFIELARRILAENPGARFLLNGAAADRPKIDVFVRALGECAQSFAGQLSLRESAALMNCASLYVGVDTGPSHIFGALKKPLVVMYHPSLRSALYKPLESSALFAIDHAAAAANASPTISMAEIGVDTVWAAVKAALNNEPSFTTGGTPPGIDDSNTAL
jgi:heptosyltransferase III